jgi:hypothetical protein
MTLVQDLRLLTGPVPFVLTKGQELAYCVLALYPVLALYWPTVQGRPRAGQDRGNDTGYELIAP